MVRFVTYSHPPMETAEMEEWEKRYRQVVGYIVAFGDMSALDRSASAAAIMPRHDGAVAESAEKVDHEDFLVEDHDAHLEQLRQWVDEQRRQYVHGMLPEYRVNLLNQIHFRWSGSSPQGQDDRGDSLMGNQHRLHRFECSSVVTVPTEASGHDERMETSTWGTTGEAEAIESVATAAVAAAPCVGATAQDLAWEEKYRALCEYKNIHGNCRVPRRYKEDRSLGMWVGNQRMSFKKGTMRPDRKRLLEAIGFETVDSRYSWSVERNTDRLERAWLDMYEALLHYHETTGNTDVPKSYVGTMAGRKMVLGRWVSRQRTNYAKGILRDDRRRMLDDIGFVWCSPGMVTLKGQDLEPLDFRTVAPTASGDGADDDSVSCGSLLSFRKQPSGAAFLQRGEDDHGSDSAVAPPAFVVVSPNPPRPTPLMRTDTFKSDPPVLSVRREKQVASQGFAESAAPSETADRYRASVATFSYDTQQVLVSHKRPTPNKANEDHSHRRTFPFLI